LEGVDKTDGYNFFYRQHVIKPALIGLIGAWMSGGVEWNIPHHHRASTFIPVQYRIEENADGSKTVWVGELEVRQRMRWAVGYTLRPGKSYLETSIRILNRTPVVNTMLCFANVAVHVNDDYQVIFPPSTQYVTQHAKREFTTWPIATNRFGGADFTAGVDVSWYKNHYSANSMFAWNYEDDFFAGYDHGREAGTMSVADHHVVPGKKFWTWGNGPRGRMWDKILTDDDGPYIELMVGAYSDNQPDYSWLQPYEVKSFHQYWYPFRGIGGVKNANLDAAVNLDVTTNGTVRLGFCTTSAHDAAMVTLKAGDKVLVEENIAINPSKPYLKQVTLPAGVDEHDLRASLSADGKELVAYSPVRLKPEPIPEPVRPPPAPKDIKTVEELYLTGLRIEQFHNPSLDPEPYWEEALSRDPGDTRVNTALGIRQLKQARFAEAEQHFRKALERLTDRYTTPKDAEATYYLGVALKAQGKNDEAFDTFYKATWNDAWRAASYYSLAEIACGRGDMTAALGFADRSLDANGLNIRALNLKAAVLRHTGRVKEALMVLDAASLKADPLDVRLMTERWLATKNRDDAEMLRATLRDYPAPGLETAAEYLNAGLWEDGTTLLKEMVAAARDKSQVTPMVYYYLGDFAEKLGQTPQANESYRLAEQMSPDCVFPFQVEDIPVLQQAMEVNPADARAPYYLGDLLFDWQPEEAVKLWEQSAALDPSFPIVQRNLAIACSHQDKEGSPAKAVAYLEKTVSLGDKYPVHFFELDQLYESAGTPPEKRLAVLENHQKAVAERDDALARAISLKVFAGKYDEAIALMQSRQFNIWEGGARYNVTDPWTDAHLLRGHQYFAAKQYREALADYQAALSFPDNLRAERREGSGPRSAEVAYWIGTAYEALGENPKAKQSWQEAVVMEPPRPGGRGGRRGGVGASVPDASGRGTGVAASVSDASGRRGAGASGMVSERNIQRYYQALAQRKLGQNDTAENTFRQLVTSGTEALSQTSGGIDFFSAFGERQTQRSRTAMAHYVAGLGYLELGETDKAKEEFVQTLQSSPDHLGAKTALAQIQ